MPGILEGLGLIAILIALFGLTAVVCIFGMAFYVMLKIFTRMEL